VIYPQNIYPILSYGSNMETLEVRFYTTNKTNENIRVIQNRTKKPLTEPQNSDIHQFSIPIKNKGHYLSIISGLSNSTIKPFTNKVYVPDPLDMKIAILGSVESGYSIADSLLKSLLSKKPDFVVTTGNLTERPATPSEWIKFCRHFEPLFKKSVLMPTPSKSEISGAHASRFFSPYNSKNHYYAYILKGTSLIFLDSNQDSSPGSPQYNWLTNILKRSKYNWKLVFTQMPVRSVVSTNRPTLHHLVPTFEQYHVNLVFSGGDHVYERFHINGVIYVTTGLAGASPDPINVNSKLRKAAFVDTPHFLEVELTERRIFVTAYNTNLTVLDKFKIID